MNTLLEQYARQAAAAYKSHQEGLTQDTEDCVNFLLTLKNRSVMTPETIASNDDNIMASPVRHPISPAANGVSDSYDSDASPSLAEESVSQQQRQDEDEDEEHSKRSIEKLLGKSDLVMMDDRDLVPDPLFVAMAQMKLCKLTDADRVGSYKSRPIGFVGMCCRHCGGQPGFGKYFPASVRSLAQTTTSQTILKHVSSKCQFSPPHIREAVQELQRLQSLKEAAASSTGGRPRYGSRKVFFQRVWSRLHDVENGSAMKTPPHSDDERSFVSSMSSPEMSPYKTVSIKKKRKQLPCTSSPKRQRTSTFFSI